MFALQLIRKRKGMIDKMQNILLNLIFGSSGQGHVQ